jgi:putative endonuclease
LSSTGRLDRNWRCDEGEIDLVLREGPVVVVAEVRTRTSDACGSSDEAVSEAKLDRLRRLGRRWAEDHGLHPPETRVDLVAVLRPPRGAAVVEHVRGIG